MHRFSEELIELPEAFPKNDGGRVGDIEGMFGAVLGNFERGVAEIDDVLADAFHFVTHDEGVFGVAVGMPLVERDAAFHLFHGQENVTFGFK